MISMFKKYRIQITASLVILFAIVSAGINSVSVNNSKSNLAAISNFKLSKASGSHCEWPKKPEEGCLDKDEYGPLSQTRTWYIRGQNCKWVKKTKVCDPTCPRPDTFSECQCASSEANESDCVKHTWVVTGINNQCTGYVVSETPCSDACPKPVPEAPHCQHLTGDIDGIEIDYGVGISKTLIEEHLDNSTCEIIKTEHKCSSECEVLETEPLVCIGTNRVSFVYNSQICEWEWDGLGGEENSPECIGAPGSGTSKKIVKNEEEKITNENENVDITGSPVLEKKSVGESIKIWFKSLFSWFK